MRHAFAVVPPMSNESTSPSPARRPRCTAASAPPTGPDSMSRTGNFRAVGVAVMPPPESIMNRRRRRPRAAEPFFQPLEVAGHQRLHVRVHRRRGRALELLDLGEHLGRERHRQRGVRGGQALDGPLVGGVGVGVQQADGDGLHALGDERGEHP